MPSRDERHLFEMLVLEGAQAGLSWYVVLKKREHYRKVFDQFDPAKVARYTARKQASLLKDPGIVRNRAKVAAAVGNARAFLEVVEERDSFADYLWGFVGGEPIVNRWRRTDEVPASTPLSDTLSRDLRKRGFKFVGPTICYSFMQAVGIVNDHITSCFRYRELNPLRSRRPRSR